LDRRWPRKLRLWDLLKIINPQPKLTCTPAEIVHYYWKEAGKEGIRPDVAFAQAILERVPLDMAGMFCLPKIISAVWELWVAA
jgi:hypothetical protein